MLLLLPYGDMERLSSSVTCCYEKSPFQGKKITFICLVSCVTSRSHKDHAFDSVEGSGTQTQLAPLSGRLCGGAGRTKSLGHSHAEAATELALAPQEVPVALLLHVCPPPTPRAPAACWGGCVAGEVSVAPWDTRTSLGSGGLMYCWDLKDNVFPCPKIESRVTKLHQSMVA